MAKDPNRRSDQPEQAEHPRLARNPEMVPSMGEFLGALSSRVRTLVVLAMIGIGGPTMLEACFGPEAVDTAGDPVLLTHREGPWSFKMYRTGEAEVTNEHRKTLYHFIKGTLEKKNLFPADLTESDRRNLIDAIIHFCRQLNTQDLDEFDSIVGETIYFPEYIYVEGQDGKHYSIELGFTETDEKDKELIEALGEGGEGPEISVLNGKLDKLLEQTANAYERNPNENIWPKVMEFNRLMERTGTESYHEIMRNYGAATRGEMNPYMDKTAAQIQDEIERLEGEENGKKKNKEKIEKLTRVLHAKMYEELFELLKKMDPNQVESKRVLKGTVLDAAVPFYELGPVWEWKKKHKSQNKDSEAYDIVIDELTDRSNTVTLESWLSSQKAACDYFARNGTALGYNRELTQYMTPSVIAAVMHAEFFSELSGRAFLDLLPVAIESGNLIYGPSVGDTEFSSGEVQIVKGTLENILSNRGETLRAIQMQDFSFTLSIPQRKTKTVKRGRKTETIAYYDNQEIINAMITDLPSHAFYTILTIADHIELGFNELMNDSQFKRAWDSAPESERYLFMASFSAMAINNGRGSPKHENGAYQTGVNLLKQVDSSSLTAYITAIPEAASDSVPWNKKSKKTTVARNARKGLEAMQEMLRRAQNLETVEEVAVIPEPVKPSRIPIYTDYDPMRRLAISDGYPISNDKEANRRLYAAALNNPDAVNVPEKHEYFFRKPNPDSVARMERDAYEIFVQFAKEFKTTTGYTLSYTDVLRTPEYQDKMSPIDDSTHYTGRTIDIPDGRFLDPKGKEITWSVPDGKPKKGKPQKFKRGPDADTIEQKLRPALIELMEEYQARGYMMVFDETHGGGHWHIYIPKYREGSGSDL